MKFKLLLLTTLFTFTQNAYASDNPLFVTITSKYCSTCKELDPVVEELKSKYDGKITFIKLDVSSKDSIEAAKDTANQYGISNFYEKNKMSIPRVGLFCTGAEKPEKSFLGETNKEIYEEAVSDLLTNTAKVCVK
jgi:thiol-disulfide isomerase/thioredoxin